MDDTREIVYSDEELLARIGQDVTDEEFFRDLKSDLDQVFKSNEFKFADEGTISQYVEQVREVISEQTGIPVDDIEMRRIQDEPFVYKVIIHGPKYTEIELRVDT